MQRGIWIYIVGVLVSTGVIVALGAPVMIKDAQVGSLILGVTGFIPLIMAYIAHRMSGATGNPFKGLIWGPTAMYMAAWLGGVAVGLVAVGLSLGLGLARVDMEMTDYMDMVVHQSEKSGKAMPSDALGYVRTFALVGAFAGPFIGAWFATILMCLRTFPWLGWLYRRLLVRGRVPALLALTAMWLILGAGGGLIAKSVEEDVSLPMLIVLGALTTAAVAPAAVWLFLRTGSAVIPALALSSYQAVLQSSVILLSDVNQTLAVPMGVLASAIPLLVGIALWIWKDPGGEQLEVAAIAGDGTPLTRQQLMALSEPTPVGAEYGTPTMEVPAAPAAPPAAVEEPVEVEAS